MSGLKEHKRCGARNGFLEERCGSKCGISEEDPKV
jgi:ribosomal protein L40E